MQKKLRLLAVTFDTHLESWELPKFRAAIAQKVGLQHEWFHNHNNNPEPDSPNPAYHYRYSLIQYKCLFNHPMLLCLDKGVDEAHHFFAQADWTININHQDRPLPIKNLELREFLPNSHQTYTYRIYNWMPLNSEDYRHFQTLRALSDILQFLQARLLSHILSFAEGVGWALQDRLSVKIIEFLPERLITFKGLKMQTFNFIFEVNLMIPDMVGLGRGVSQGFGTVRPYRLQ